jgi:hypothetical protein
VEKKSKSSIRRLKKKMMVIHRKMQKKMAVIHRKKMWKKRQSIGRWEKHGDCP